MIAILVSNILILFTVPYLIWRKSLSPNNKFFWPALILKYSAGIILGLLYSKYYSVGDTFSYFEDGSRVASLVNHDLPTYFRFLWASADQTLMDELAIPVPRGLFFTKFVSVFVLLSGYNYWVTCCYFSLISFLGAWFLLTEFARYQNRFTDAATLALFFFPSVVFWTSGLIKESLAMACLYFICGVFLKVRNSFKVKIIHWIVLFPALWILWGLKYYYLAVLFPVLLTEIFMTRVILKRYNELSTVKYATVWLFIFVIPLAFASVIHPNFYPERFLDVIVSNHNIFVEISDPEDIIRFTSLTATGTSILANAPVALMSGLFRPFIWEANNPLQWVAAIENAALFFLFAGAVIQLVRRKQSSSLLGAALVYCILLCVFLTLSTPNFGTLSRYRVGFLPFFVMLISVDNLFINWIDGFVRRSFG
jgi:hypothetical protein